MKWIVEKGIIKGIADEKVLVPTSEDIFSSNESITINGEEYSFDIENIKFSRLLSKECTITFVCFGNRIKLKVTVKHKKNEYDVNYLDGKIVSYIIIDNVWYYLDPSINKINSIFEQLGLKASDPFDYFDYINLIKQFNELLIRYNDEVKNKIDSIKNTPSNIEINGFIGKLFKYQESGIRWLTYMVEGNCGCILADEMGLGKTLQIILTMAYLKEHDNKHSFLVIAPVSLLENWKREIEKFYPNLSCLIHHGSNRICSYQYFLKFDVVITSYGNVQTDLSIFEMINWNLIILDEAQNIKNPYAKRTKNVKRLNKELGIAVTGTPFENHLTDIWSITDFVLPQFFGTIGEFENSYFDSVESAKDIEKALSPIMIRRKVNEVADDLPKKIEISQPILMDDNEASLYESGRNDEDLQKIELATIQKLRMFCTHPSVYNDDYCSVDPLVISNKYQRLCELVEEIIINKEKVIIFTSFKKMISLLVKDLRERFGIPTDYIDGSIESQTRQNKIDNFSLISGGAVLILNPKAAGTGLNITAANHVIHYNLEWNPAVEDQASARAYRRGQNKTVFIYRLYYKDTVEEIINERIERKREISDIAVVGNKGELDSQDLVRALTISPIKR